jgi:hypothetical protein
MKRKNRVSLMSDRELDELQEAGDDVGYLTMQGYSPTEAVAKVASAAQFPPDKTKLLIYAYANGMSEEKRASAGGPFERLGTFPLPDPEEVMRLVYGEKEAEPEEATKTASFCEEFSPPMELFRTGLSGLSREGVRKLAGLSEKTAEEEKPKGFSISRTTIRVGLGSALAKEEKPEKCRCGFCPSCMEAGVLPESFASKLEGKMPKLPKEISEMLELVFPGFLKEKEAAMSAANDAADLAFHHVRNRVAALGAHLRSHHWTPQYKRAGLASVHAYYPEVAKMLGTCLDDLNGALVKQAECSLSEITSRHPWVREAEEIRKELEKTASLTLDAREKAEEYAAACLLYENRNELKRKQPFGSGKTGGIYDAFIGSMGTQLVTGNVRKLPGSSLIFGRDTSEDEKKFRSGAERDLNSPEDVLRRRDIEIPKMLNDFAVNDEILSAFTLPQLARAYTELIRTSPDTLRTPSQARALLQQYMTQGRLAPTEVLPVLQMDELNPVRHRREEARQMAESA